MWSLSSRFIDLLWKCEGQSFYISPRDTSSNGKLLDTWVLTSSFVRYRTGGGGHITPQANLAHPPLLRLWTAWHISWKFQDPSYYDLWPVTWFPRSWSCFQGQVMYFWWWYGQLDRDRCCEVTSMVYTDIVTFPRSTEVIRGQWPLITSERAQRAERVLSYLREKSEYSRPGPTRPGPITLFKAFLISGTACLIDKRSSLMNTTWM